MVNLNGDWTLYPIEKSGNITEPRGLEPKKAIKAKVPGNVEIDLISAGMLPEDIFKGENIRQAEKYELYDWWYEKKFTTPKHSRDMMLCFEGVDTIAEYWLNGRKFASSDNALTEHVFNVTEYLNPEGEENTLYVYIKSAVVEANHYDYDFYIKKGTWPWSDGMMIRKAPHSFGWDIMPRAVSAGIWKDVSLYERDLIEIDQIYYRLFYMDSEAPGIRFIWQLDIPDELLKSDIKVKFTGRCGDSSFEVIDKVRFKSDGTEVRVKDAKLWWPSGYGEANLYDVTMTVLLDDNEVSKRDITIGFREVKLERTSATLNERGHFRFIVNGVKIMCRGTNWVPLSPYHSMDKKRYKKALPLLSEINCNMVRLWGGNVYEQDEFYDYCDRNGIMVWQDFSMACMTYSQHEDFCRKMEEEAVKVVRRLRHHSSIVLWCGDNECDIGHDGFGTRPENNRLTREVIPRVLENNELLTARPYIPSSPCVDEISGNDIALWAENHVWGNREYFKSDFYTRQNAEFISEIGYLSMTSVESLKKFIDEEYLWDYKDNPQWIFHSTSQTENPHQVDVFIVDDIKAMFGDVPNNLTDFCMASQIVQAEAMKFFMERMRSDRSKYSGVLLWNLLDGWPQNSTGMVDYYFDKKLSFKYVKNSQKPFAMFVGEQANWQNPLIAANDTLKEKNVSYKVYDIDNGEVWSEGKFKIHPNSTKTVDSLKLNISKHSFLVLEWTVDGVKHYNHYLAGRPGFDFEKYKRWLEKFNQISSKTEYLLYKSEKYKLIYKN